MRLKRELLRVKKYVGCGRKYVLSMRINGRASGWDYAIISNCTYVCMCVCVCLFVQCYYVCACAAV